MLAYAEAVEHTGAVADAVADDEAASVDGVPSETGTAVAELTFPVLGPVTFTDDWHAPRSGGRLHEGLDLLGVAGQPVRAVFDGTVTDIDLENTGTAGVRVTVTRDDGVYANYFHLNDDTPGTADGAAPAELRVHPAIETGTRVAAGQVIGYMGDSGNAGVPHLHFELRTADGVPLPPYAAVRAAADRERCKPGLTPGRTPVVAGDGPATITAVTGPGGAAWQIGSDGTVSALGAAGLIAVDADCPTDPSTRWMHSTGHSDAAREATD